MATTATRTERVMRSVRSQIANRALVPGDRLPSVRRCAETMGVSATTVVEAYDRLVAEGVIHARRGSGFYVSGTHLPPLAIAENSEARPPTIDPFWITKQSLDADPELLAPGCGWLRHEWMPGTELQRAIRGLSRQSGDVLFGYGSTRGSSVLRRYLLGRFAEEGLEITPDQVLLTLSGTQAIDLLCRLLLQPGDAVLIDDPCYFNFQTLLRAHRVRIVGVPYTFSGPDVGVFESVLAAEKPRLYITNSALHNPTGATMSAQTAHRLLGLAAKNDLLIVEDEIFGDFEPTPSARMAVLDGLERVIRIGSFSKTLSASIRCGYIAGKLETIEALSDLQVATNFGGPSPAMTDLVSNVLLSGGYRKHLDELRRRLNHARQRAINRLAPLGIEPWLVPRGGFYLWAGLPDGLDSAPIAERCMDEKILLAPGNVFSLSQTASSFLRFNIAHMDDERIFAALASAMKAQRNAEA